MLRRQAERNHHPRLKKPNNEECWEVTTEERGWTMIAAVTLEYNHGTPLAETSNTFNNNNNTKLNNYDHRNYQPELLSNHNPNSTPSPFPHHQHKTLPNHDNQVHHRANNHTTNHRRHNNRKHSSKSSPTQRRHTSKE